MRLFVLDTALAVCRLDAGAALPEWATAAPFFSLTRTADELSIVCAEAAVPPTVRCERGWRALQVAGPLDFALVGLLASLTGTLAQADIPLFALSTFDTDFLLVRGERLGAALAALRSAGHQVEEAAAR